MVCEDHGVCITLGDLLRCLEDEFLNDNIVDWALKFCCLAPSVRPWFHDEGGREGKVADEMRVHLHCVDTGT